MLQDLGSEHLAILLTHSLYPVFRPNERLPSFNFQKARCDDFAFYFDSHCSSAEEYSSLSLSSAAALFTSLTLNALLTIWCSRQTALFLFLLAKAALAYLPTALYVALRPPFSFQQAQYAQVFPLKPAPSCKLFAGIGSSNRSASSLPLFLPGNDAADEPARREALLMPSAIPCRLSSLISSIHSYLFWDWRRTVSSKFFDTQIPSISTEDLVLLRHAHCFLSSLLQRAQPSVKLLSL